MLRDFDLVVDGPLHGAVSSKAIFVKAFDKGVPVAVKVYDAAQVAQNEFNYVPFSVGLVPQKQLTPEQSQTPTKPSNTTGMALNNCSLNETAPPIRKVFIVMPIFPSTARQYPLPGPENHVLSYGKDILSGLQHCWDRGFGFCAR